MNKNILRVLATVVFLLAGWSAANADSTITNLPAATPAPTDPIPCVHAGVTSKCTPQGIVSGGLLAGELSVISASTYGADPTNTVGASSAINSTLSAAAAVPNGVAYIPAGTYQINAVLAIPNHTVLRCADRDSTTLQLKAGSAFGGMIYQGASPTVGVVIENCTFDVNSVASMSAIQFYNAQNAGIIIRHSRFKNANGVWAIVIGGVETPGNIAHVSTDVQFTDNVVQNNAETGLEDVIFSSISNSEVARNKFINNITSPLGWSVGFYGYANNLDIHDNLFSNPGVSGDMYVTQASHVLIHHNQHVAGAATNVGMTQINNSQYVTVDGDTYDMRLTVDGSGFAMGLADYTGFDGHTVRFLNSSNITFKNTLTFGRPSEAVFLDAATVLHNYAWNHVVVENNTAQLTGVSSSGPFTLAGSSATGVDDVNFRGNTCLPGTWVFNGCFEIIGNSNVTHVVIADNIIHHSSGTGAQPVILSGAGLSSVAIGGNNYSDWSGAIVSLSGGATYTDYGNASNLGQVFTALPGVTVAGDILQTGSSAGQSLKLSQGWTSGGGLTILKMNGDATARQFQWDGSFLAIVGMSPVFGTNQFYSSDLSQNFYFNNAGNNVLFTKGIAAGGAISGTSFTGSGSGLTSGTVPNAALVTPPVVTVAGGTNLTCTGMTAITCTPSLTPTFTSVNGKKPAFAFCTDTTVGVITCSATVAYTSSTSYACGMSYVGPATTTGTATGMTTVNVSGTSVTGTIVGLSLATGTATLLFNCLGS